MSTVLALDHVNIIAEDLDATCAFYVDLLELERRDAPPPMTPATGQWLHDRDGRPILHINSTDCPRTYDRPVMAGPTGSIHHIALRCQDHAGMIARLDARGADYQQRHVTAIGLRQIFTVDPNGVLLELNFLEG